MDGPDIPSKAFLDGDLEILRRVDAIFMLPGWENSEGSKGELALAITLGLPVYDQLEDVPDGRD
jgi:hypothetical protein